MSLPWHRLEIESTELARALEREDPVQILDVRAPEALAAGVIQPDAPHRFRNLRGSVVADTENLADLGLDAALPVAVVCGHGNDSLKIAALLRDHGYEARSLRGGITSWMRLAIPRELEAPEGFDRLVQFDRVGKGALGYLLVSEDEGLAIDPSRDWRPYAGLAAEAGAAITAVADTHVHADYISGGPAMAAELGIRYHLPPADAAYPHDGAPGRLTFQPLRDGDGIRVGRGCVRAAHTPGHTEGHVTLLAADGAAAFTGDFLFVHGLGRPDLAGRSAKWTADLWRSLERVRHQWSPDTMVYPAHYGSTAERNFDRSVGCRFARLCEENEALRFMEEESFAGWIASRVAPFPDAYRRIKAINVGIASVTSAEADVLEAGWNQCAIG